MIYQKFKEEVVTEKGWTSAKAVRKLAVRLGLFVFFLALGLGVVTYITTNAILTFLVLLLSGVSFLWFFDWAVESLESYKFVDKMSKFWWLLIIVDVVITIVLKFFNFM